MIVAREQVQQNYGIPREEVKKTTKPKRGRQISSYDRVLLIGMVVMAFITGIIISFYYAQVFATNYRIHSLQKELVILHQQTDDMYGKIAALTSLERIEEVAINQLGMVKPVDGDVVRIAVNVDSGEAIDNPEVLLQNSEPIGQKKTGEVSKDQKENWIIRSFVDLVGQVKEGVPSR